MMQVAVVQMVSSANSEENLATLNKLLAQASALGVKLLVLPENFAFMGLHEKDKLIGAEAFGSGKIQQTISKLANQYAMWVIAGTQFIASPTPSQKRVRASSLVYDDQGKCVARYDKIHLFDVRVSQHEAHRESQTIEPGNQLEVVDTPFGKIGLSVCYDLRFPELYRQLVKKGAEIIVIPSAFTFITGMAHWEVLIRARAIENLCYVLAPNQGGTHDNGRKTYGHSMIVDPWGKILNELEYGAGVVDAEIDLKYLHQLREQFPCNEHHVLEKTNK